MNLFAKSSYWIFASLLLFAAEGSVAETGAPMATGTGAMELYKSPTCGCCQEWRAHMSGQGFESTVHHPRDLNAVKEQLGIQPQYQSCHTAVIGEKFVIEGHVPARYVKQFLKNPPEGALGLAVPGMPVGSPGMEVGDRFQAYDILLLKADGSSSVFSRVGSSDDQ